MGIQGGWIFKTSETNFEMKFLCFFTALFAVAQAQFSINLPKAGATIQPGQNLTVQVFVPIDSTMQAASTEISLVIGIINCGSAPCPSPSDDLGEFVFVGKYVSQGPAHTQNPNSFGNFSITVPNDISGTASIQAMRVSAFVVKTHAQPRVQYTSVQVTTSGGSGSSLNIHPNGDNTKCVGILGGTYANGTPVDIYDCNASATQKWQWNGNSLQSTNPADGSNWCLDSGVQSTWADGLKMKIWQCFPNLPQQTWTPVNSGSSGTIKLTAPNSNFCLDLTNGVKTNQNMLQIWTCFAGNTNQIWSATSV